MKTIAYGHLTNLAWKHGEADCFQLIRRFYAENFQIDIPNVNYQDEWWNTEPEKDYFTQNVRSAGFQPVLTEALTAMKPGWGLLFAQGAAFVTHCGVWIGNGSFLHHPRNEPSRIERWAGRWQGRTVSIWHHPQASVGSTVETLDMISLMPAGKRERYREILASRLA